MKTRGRYFIVNRYFANSEYENDNIVNISEEIAKQHCYKIAISKFGYGSEYREDNDRNILYEYPNENEDCIIAICAKNDMSITINDEVINILKSDIILFENGSQYKIDNLKDSFIFKFKEVRQELIVGDGNNLYEVIATIRDEYRLKVRANNSQDAINLANTIEIGYWKHPVIEPHLKDTKILRHARWGNLMATEITEK